MVGSPVSHSLSPVIHRAGYAAAGLTDWSYTTLECPEGALAALAGGLGADWAGLSVTMPLKSEALALADRASAVAVAVGAANTLTHDDTGGWAADNTDVPGAAAVLSALGVRGGPAVVLGAGGTARAAIAALGRCGVSTVTVVARRPEAGRALAPVAEASGLRLAAAGWSQAPELLSAPTVVATVPRTVTDQLAGQARWHAGGVLLEALYDPWPTPLAAAAAANNVRVASGLDLLLAQAVEQFRLITAVTAPTTPMRAALAAAVPGWRPVA
ncbi:shikimate dehydrogenase [Pilimelia columellifera]|uniref:shikimate dehydrogenase n=1 Tax=Pilimelia columellifera TaxID=706574 RepID=UPI0031DAD3BD